MTTKTQRVEALMARNVAWPIHRDAVRLIAMEEDCRLNAYLCDAGVWTCGWGETAGVRPGMRWTQEQADARFLASLTEYAAAVDDMTVVPTSMEQKGALVSLAYNIGLAGLRGSTVMRLHNKADFEGAARAFGLWNKARKDGVLRAHPVLTARRMTEAALYLRQDPELSPPVGVQAVVGESKLAQSPIAQGGALTIGAGALGVLGEAKEFLGPVGETAGKAKMLIVETLGFPGWVLPLLLVVAGASVVFWRWKQRRHGWV